MNKQNTQTAAVKSEAEIAANTFMLGCIVAAVGLTGLMTVLFGKVAMFATVIAIGIVMAWIGLRGLMDIDRQDREKKMNTQSPHLVREPSE
jgi:hypothetical protein